MPTIGALAERVAVVGEVDAACRGHGVGLAPVGVRRRARAGAVTAILQRIETGFRGAVLGGLADIVAAGANVVTVAILGGFLTFFLLQDGDRAWAWVLNASGGWRRGALMAGGRRAVDQVGGYVRTSVTAVATAVLAGLLMVLLGVPLAGPLAVVVLTAAFVPYVGRTIAGIVIVAVTLATRGGVPASALLVLYWTGATALDRVLARLEAGRRLELHPILAVLGLPIGFAMAGFFGLIIILPVLAFAQTAAGVIITALGRGASGCSRRAGHVQCLGGQRRPGVAGSPGSMELALAHRGGVVDHRHPGGAPVAWGDPASRDGCDPLAATLHPASAALQRRGAGRTMAAAIVTVGTGVAIIAVVVVTLASLAGPIAELTSTATEGAEASGAQAIGVGSFVSAINSGLIATVGAAVANAISAVIVLLLGAFLTFYFIRDGARVWGALTRGVPAARRGLLDTAGTRAVDVLGGYMVGTAAISAFGAASQWVIMVLLGLPLAFPLAVLALFAGFIPYIGGFIATFLAFLVAIAVGSPTAILVMAIYTLVFNIIQGNFVTPLVYGKAVSLHPAIVLLAAPIGNALAGIVGMFLVVPVAGVIATSWRAILQVIDVGGSDSAVPVAEARPGDEPGPVGFGAENEPRVGGFDPA